MACPLCGRRKGKRSCPAQGAKICSICCGTHREQTLACPFDCRYLQQARANEPVGFADDEQMPYPEVRIEDRQRETLGPLLDACARAMLQAALETPGASDRDARAALEALIETYKTLSSGIYYERRPESLYARAIARSVGEAIEEFRREDREQTGMTRFSDGDVVKALVLLLRVGVARDNGRAKGRAFLHFLLGALGEAGESPLARSESPIILPGA